MHYSTKMGAVRCTEILLRKGAELKQNSEDPPVVPPVIKFSIHKGCALILDQVIRLRQTNSCVKYLGDCEIMATLQQEDQTLMKTALNSPVLVRSMLNLLLSMETTSQDGTETPELEFLKSRLQIIGQLSDEKKRRGGPLTLPTIVSLLT